MTQKPDGSTDPDAKPDDGSDKGDRKERVLHTRVPAVLEAELKTVARALRVPVSNLVRTILEDAVAIADRASSQVEQRLEAAARSVETERARLRARLERNEVLQDVLAYQAVIVAAPNRCARCEAPLEPGDDAALAIRDRPGPSSFVCTACVPKPKSAKP
ncbi:MAG: hypothetical protein HOW73_23560 [Polyangiaceae bacterium]|nr:hypothetical protein [Polyangiaceae bacterium]